MRLPIVINGALGKMGVEIAGLVLDDGDFELQGAVERADHPKQGEDFGVLIGKGLRGIAISDHVAPGDLEDCVIVDFSTPQSTAGFLRAAVEKKLRIVIGTTGLSDEQYVLAEKASRNSAILISPNMSLGVNLLFLLTDIVSSRLKNSFDIEVIEAHHRFKKDAPSGTAHRLGEIVAKAYGLDYEQAIRNGRSGITTADRPKNEIGMHSIRGGDIIGDHTVLFAGFGERIELRHMMHSRAPLAAGALTAAKWLAGRNPGYYSMRDVLGL